MQVSLTVNNKAHSAEVEPRVLLVDFLRENVGLTGTKVGCDTGQCGACVVLMDGVSVKSCALVAAQADGSTITTIEGVSPMGRMNALQSAFQQMHAVQCGFCTPGMIMSLTDLNEHHPDASETEVREWLTGSLCRCTGYENVVRAVVAARNIAANPAHMLADTTNKVLYEHIVMAMQAGDVEAWADFYSDDVVLTTFEGVIIGKEALKRYLTDYVAQSRTIEIVSTDRFIEVPNAFYVEATVRVDGKVTHIYNEFVVQSGKITHEFASVK